MTRQMCVLTFFPLSIPSFFSFNTFSYFFRIQLLEPSSGQYLKPLPRPPVNWMTTVNVNICCCRIKTIRPTSFIPNVLDIIDSLYQILVITAGRH